MAKAKAKVKMMTPAEFTDRLPQLIERLTNDLEREQEDCALPELGSDPLWDTPAVDSKTVAKLSPAVKEITGESLDPKWIQRGGYQSVEAAVTHIVSQIQENLVALPAPPASAPAPEEAAATH